MRRHSVTAALLLASLQVSDSFSADSAAPTIETCKAIADAAARLRCYESATSAPRQRSPTAPTTPTASDDWQLVRTPRPGGGDVVSVMRTADLLHSDPGFAGLALHCGEKGPDILLIVIEPFPPRSRPQVTIGDPTNAVHFEASVLPSGAALLLPDEATALAKGPWQSQASLSVTIESNATRIHGVVPVNGLGPALQKLSASCPLR